MSHLLLLVIHLCIVGTTSQTVVRGVEGQEIILPCTYNIQSGTNHMCWGQGSCPNSKCSNEILRTDGVRVISRTSSRYQLRGRITRGDVSLTLVNLKEGDRGMYCCRIEVPGWFNDLKKTLNLQVDRATTTTFRTTTTTKPPTVPATTTSIPLTTTVTLPTTAFLLTTNPPPLAVPTVPPLTTNAPKITTSSMKEAIEFLTSDLPFIDINPSTPSLQTTYGYNYNFLTTESEIHPSTAVTTFPPDILLTPKNPENNENQPSSVPAVVQPITTALSTTISSTSASAALLTASPPLVNNKTQSTSPQHECNVNGSLLTPEAVASSTGIADVWRMLSHNHVAFSCAVVVFILFLVLLILIVKRKNIRQYQLNKTKSINKAEEPGNILVEPEGENGIFAL